MQFVLDLQVGEVRTGVEVEVCDVRELEHQPPLVQAGTEQGRTVFGLRIDRHADHGVVDRDVLVARESLLNFNQFMLAHHQHLTQVADATGPRGRVTHLYALQGDVPLF